MIEPVSLNELCKDGKPIYIAALRVDDPTIDLAIDLEPEAQLSLHSLYRLSEYELEILCEYLNECLRGGFIRPSKAATGAPVLLTPKKDSGLRMCKDYRELNAKSLKNRYIIRCCLSTTYFTGSLAGAKLFIALDLINAYHRIRTRVENRFPHAAGCLEYLVVPFGLTMHRHFSHTSTRRYVNIWTCS